MRLLFIIISYLFIIGCSQKTIVITEHDYKITWDRNKETIVNKEGGGYIIYYSKKSDFSNASTINIPFTSDMLTKNQLETTIELTTGTWYLKIKAYGFDQRLSETTIMGEDSLIKVINVP